MKKCVLDIFKWISDYESLIKKQLNVIVVRRLRIEAFKVPYDMKPIIMNNLFDK